MADPAPLTQDIRVYQDSTFQMELLYAPNGSPVDLSDWTGDLDLAADYTTPAVLHLDEDAGLSFGADGVVTITISDEATNALALYDEATDFRYDLHIEDPQGTRIRVLMGKATIVAKVKSLAA